MVYKQFEGYEDGLFTAGRSASELNSTIELGSESRNSTEEDASPTITGDRTSRSLISRKVFYSLMKEKLKL